MGALTSRPYSFTQRPWELHASLANPIFNCLGVYLRVEFDKGKVSRILPTRYQSIFWVSDFVRLFIKNAVSNFSIRKIFSNGVQGIFFTSYKLNLFPSVLYNLNIIEDILILSVNKILYLDFLLFNKAPVVNFKIFALTEWQKEYYSLYNFILFYNFSYSFRLILTRFLFF